MFLKIAKNSNLIVEFSILMIFVSHVIWFFLPEILDKVITNFKILPSSNNIRFDHILQDAWLFVLQGLIYIKNAKVFLVVALLVSI